MNHWIIFGADGFVTRIFFGADGFVTGVFLECGYFWAQIIVPLQNTSYYDASILNRLKKC
ncbi:hypothetical protein COB57_02430 [Candidatus Peregrinibacteria bacterium]|nr:MAG: hypothetical protein COB57_02430 [Candidatus Peregrinibacteria bacterium]